MSRMKIRLTLILLFLPVLLVNKVSFAQGHCDQESLENDEYDLSLENTATDPLQVPDDANIIASLTTEQLIERNRTIRHLSLFAHTFTDSFHHWLLNLGEPCDPVVHEEWMKKSYHDFYMSDKWYKKVCTFTRFLHCNPARKVCECAPKTVYGVEFEPASPERTNYEKYYKSPCTAASGQPCYFFVGTKGQSWPGLDFRLSVNLNCPQERFVNGSFSTYQCTWQNHKITRLVAKRCRACLTPKSTASRHGGSIVTSLLWCHFILNMLITH